MSVGPSPPSQVGPTQTPQATVIAPPASQQPQTVVQATGALANEIIGGLKAQPIMLGVLVLNAMFLGIMWYMVDGWSLRRHDEVKLLLDRCFANVVLPQRQDSGRTP